MRVCGFYVLLSDEALLKDLICFSFVFKLITDYLPPFFSIVDGSM